MSKQLNKFRKNQIEVQVTKLDNSSTSHATGFSSTRFLYVLPVDHFQVILNFH